MKIIKCLLVIIEKNFGAIIIALSIIIAAYIIGYHINPGLVF